VDEVATVNLLGGSLGDLLPDIRDSESTPPLYYLLAFAWTKLFGTSEVAIRSLSALIGTATVPLAFATARRLVEERAALVAAGLVAVNPILVWYSQEARAYALLVLLTVVSLGAFAVACRRPSVMPTRAQASRRGALVLWALTSALALTTHYFAIFVILPEALWLLAAARRRGAAAPGETDRRAVAAVAGVVAVGVALIPLALRQRSHEGAAFIADLDFGARLVQLPKQYLIGFDGPFEAPAAIAAAGLALFGAMLLFTRASADERRGARIPAVVAIIGLLVPLVLAAAGADYVITRNMLAALVPLLIVLAAGFGAHAAGRLGIAGAAALCALSVALVVAVPLDARYQRSDWRAIAEVLGPAPASRAIVVSPASDTAALEHYLGPSRRLGSTGFPYREVWVVGLASQPSSTSRKPHPPGVSPGLDHLGLDPAGRRLEETFAVYRLRGDRETRYSRDALDAIAIAPGASEILLQRQGTPAGE
jgi:4-amino-4-deoxy-L-arabinose transferase-like glycosyltransferase